MPREIFYSAPGAPTAPSELQPAHAPEQCPDASITFAKLHGLQLRTLELSLPRSGAPDGGSGGQHARMATAASLAQGAAAALQPRHVPALPEACISARVGAPQACITMQDVSHTAQLRAGVASARAELSGGVHATVHEAQLPRLAALADAHARYGRSVHATTLSVLQDGGAEQKVAQHAESALAAYAAHGAMQALTNSAAVCSEEVRAPDAEHDCSAGLAPVVHQRMQHVASKLQQVCTTSFTHVDGLAFA